MNAGVSNQTRILVDVEIANSTDGNFINSLCAKFIRLFEIINFIRNRRWWSETKNRTGIRKMDRHIINFFRQTNFLFSLAEMD